MVRRKILVADDVDINRDIMREILCKDYDVLEAENGREAMDQMRAHYDDLSAVILDLVMPLMDGYSVMKEMALDEKLRGIPVIVATGSDEPEAEVEALSLGANDFIVKPYNLDVIRHRINNVIRLRETASILNTMQRDRLTGLYNREAFFDKAAEMIHSKEPGYYVMTAFDINNFKIVNEQYGTKEGDRLLQLIGGRMLECVHKVNGICCRLSADNFAMLYPADTHEIDFAEFYRDHVMSFDKHNSVISYYAGCYVVDDPSLSISSIYDRAYIAKQSIKGRYDMHMAAFDDSMLRKIMRNQQINDELRPALAERQFEVWLQPQFNHASGALIGAEALVRWRHPEKGLIPPGVFIPVLEQNGSIFELDKYVWEESCRYLRRWIDEGREALPISVNISRYDVLRPDLCEVITGLVQKYDLSVDLLRLEITESAFSQDTDSIVDVVEKLVEDGFTLEIDDFGSGYSSLNTLKDVPAGVLKLDMRFLESKRNSPRSGNIIESVVRMARWLGMSVIAEGVETIAQADFLRSIGCIYVQGYLYARPMCVEDYEQLSRDVHHEERLMQLETVENLDNYSFWDPKSVDTLIFNSYVGGACILEYYTGRIEMLRVNRKFIDLLGYSGIDNFDVLKIDLMKYLSAEGRQFLTDNLERLTRDRDELTAEFDFYDIPDCKGVLWLRSSLKVIASSGERYLIYCISDDITAQHLAEESRDAAVKQLQAIMANIEGGVTVTEVTRDSVRYLFANDRYYEQLGYTREQFEAEVSDVFELIHPADREALLKLAIDSSENRRAYSSDYRVLRRDGSVRWLRSNISMIDYPGLKDPVQLSVANDIDEVMSIREKILDNIPDGAALLEFDGINLTPVMVNKRMWTLLGLDPTDIIKPDVMNVIFPDDRTLVIEEMKQAIIQKRDAMYDLRILNSNGDYLPYHVAANIADEGNGRYTVYVSCTPVKKEKFALHEMMPVMLSTMNSSSTDLSSVKGVDLHYICCSRVMATMAGLKSELEIVGRTDYDLFDKERADKFVAADTKVIRNGEALLDIREMIPGENGNVSYVMTSRYPLKDASGRVIGIYSISRDITRSMEQDSRMKLLNDSIPGGITTFICTEERISLSYYNAGFCKLFGLTQTELDEVIDLDLRRFVRKEDLPELLTQLDNLIRNNTPININYRVMTHNGERWVWHQAEAAERVADSVVVNSLLFDVTESRETLERLRVSEEQFHIAAALGDRLIASYNIKTRTYTSDDQALSGFGFGRVVQNVPQSLIDAGVVAPESIGSIRDFYQKLQDGEPSAACTLHLKNVDGQFSWKKIEATSIFDADGNPADAVMVLYDVTEQREKEAIFNKWQQSYAGKPGDSYTLFRCNLSQDASMDMMEGSLLTISFSPQATTFAAQTQEYAEQFVHEDDRAEYIATIEPDKLFASFFRNDRLKVFEYRELTGDNSERWLRRTIELVEYPDSSDVLAYIMYENIDAEKKQLMKTKALAENDHLTGLYNRQMFVEKMEEAISQRSSGQLCALLMFDIDGFKLVNDSFGHNVGDQALLDVAGKLRSILRSGDLAGRLGGDEFVVFLRDMPNEASIERRAQQICRVMRKAFSFEVHISVSIGIAACPDDGQDFESLYHKADLALYHVKATGKDNYVFYDDKMKGERPNLEDQVEEIIEQEPDKKLKRRMLIVEDNKINRDMLARLFKDSFLIDTAEDGDAALIRLRRYGQAVSVVLLDLMMPGMDGFAVLEKMRKSPEMQNIPVVVVSGANERESSLRTIRSGASDFVTKPIDPDLLKVRVQSAISKAENDHLRMQNTYLTMVNDKLTEYQSLLAQNGIALVEYDILNGSFLYDHSVSDVLFGDFDERTLWDIMSQDMLAEADDIRLLKELVRRKCGAKAGRAALALEQMRMKLQTHSGARHDFLVKVYRSVDENQRIDKLVMTFVDQGC